jgi:hypothetical protein
LITGSSFFTIALSLILEYLSKIAQLPVTIPVTMPIEKCLKKMALFA